jgi:hypothetical protein
MTREEFLNFVSVHGDNDCWPWLGNQNGKGYGRVEYDGKLQQAHRVSWQIHHGPIPNGFNVLHTCDNTICVNQKHLFLGTQQDNVDDMIAKSRDNFGGNRPQIGSEHHNAQLNEDKVREIKRLLEEGHRHKDIAEWFEVSRQAITNISTGHRWSHVT